MVHMHDFDLDDNIYVHVAPSEHYPVVVLYALDSTPCKSDKTKHLIDD